MPENLLTPKVIDEAGPDYSLALVSWRDSEEEPWRSVTSFALKSAGELRRVIAEAIASGRTKHQFYKLDHGKLRTSSEAISIETEDGEGNIMKNKTTKKSILSAKEKSGFRREREIAPTGHSKKSKVAPVAKPVVDESLKKAIADAKAKNISKELSQDANTGTISKAKKTPDLEAHFDAAVAEIGETLAKAKASAKDKETDITSTLKPVKTELAPPYHDWYTMKVDGDSKQLTDGPYAEKREALSKVGNKSGDYSSKIAKGCYRRIDKRPDGSKVAVYLVMTAWFAKGNGFSLHAKK
jgi:hypothetical protein